VAEELVRIEVALDGGQILSAPVTQESADALDRALRSGSSGTAELQSEDATILLVLPRVLYLKRFARETRVGFKA
jgi:molybdopterin-binding protein